LHGGKTGKGNRKSKHGLYSVTLSDSERERYLANLEALQDDPQQVLIKGAALLQTKVEQAIERATADGMLTVEQKVKQSGAVGADGKPKFKSIEVEAKKVDVFIPAIDAFGKIARQVQLAYGLDYMQDVMRDLERTKAKAQARLIESQAKVLESGDSDKPQTIVITAPDWAKQDKGDDGSNGRGNGR
jgi:hypothetical protein